VILKLSFELHPTFFFFFSFSLEERLTSHGPTKKKAQFGKWKWKASSPESVGWSWPEVGEDGEDAWFGVFHNRLLFLYNKIK
jgi:hypothetical protein